MGKECVTAKQIALLKGELEQVKKDNQKCEGEQKKREEYLNSGKKEKGNELPEYIEYSERIRNLCFCKPMYDKIKSLGWGINSYCIHRSAGYIPVYDFYDKPIEKYECTHNGWVFTVDYLYDPDIEPGIWRVYGLKREGSEETCNWYCDLGCRNTSEDKLERFLDILSCSSVEEYIKKVYGRYQEIPMLFKEKFGDFTPSIEGLTGRYTAHVKGGIPKDLGRERFVIQVLDGAAKCYLVLFSDIYDEMKFVITDTPNWDANSSNSTLGRHMAYYITYNGPEDLDLLCGAIHKFMLHMEGEIGFLEDGKYIKDIDIFRYFYNLSNKVSYPEGSEYYMKFNYNDIWDMRGYADEDFMPSLITGKQIHSEMAIRFYRSKFVQGYKSFKLAFIFTYDTRVHTPDAMSLRVCGHTLDLNEGKFEFRSEEAEAEWIYKDDWHKNSWDYANLSIDEEYKGKYSELIEVADRYLKAACESFGINSDFI